MANVKIGDLTDIGTGLAAADLLEMETAGGVSRKTAVSRVGTFVRALFTATPATIAEGGTGSSTAAAARTALGVNVPLTNATTSDPLPTSDASAGYSIGSSWTNTATGITWRALDVTNGAAVWIPGSAADHPGYVSGRFYSAQRGLGGTIVVAADTLYAIPVYIAQRITIQALACRVTASAAGNVKIGIYSNVNGAPGVKLTEVSTPPSTNSVAALSAALAANYIAAPGMYWMACIFSSAPTLSAISAADQYMSSVIGSATAIEVFNATSSVAGVTGTGATYTGGLPSSFGAASTRALATPLLGFQTL